MTEQEAATMARREYHRQWRRANPDKAREYNRRYWEKKAREFLQSLTGAEKEGGRT